MFQADRRSTKLWGPSHNESAEDKMKQGDSHNPNFISNESGNQSPKFTAPSDPLTKPSTNIHNTDRHWHRKKSNNRPGWL